MPDERNYARAARLLEAALQTLELALDELEGADEYDALAAAVEHTLDPVARALAARVETVPAYP
jgi:hypothetical protein